MQADQAHILQLSADSSKSIPALYKEVAKTISPATRVELYIDVSEYDHIQRSTGKNQPQFLVSDILLLLFENVPNMKELFVDGYEMYCHSKDFMVYKPNYYGLFYAFDDFVEKYTMSGETKDYFQSVERMEFKKCCLTENDLQVLSSSIFPNLKSIYCWYSTPLEMETRRKYEDFLPNIEWDDQYYEEDATQKNLLQYYNPLYNDINNQE